MVNPSRATSRCAPTARKADPCEKGMISHVSAIQRCTFPWKPATRMNCHRYFANFVAVSSSTAARMTMRCALPTSSFRRNLLMLRRSSRCEYVRWLKMVLKYSLDWCTFANFAVKISRGILDSSCSQFNRAFPPIQVIFFNTSLLAVMPKSSSVNDVWMKPKKNQAKEHTTLTLLTSATTKSVANEAINLTESWWQAYCAKRCS